MIIIDSKTDLDLGLEGVTVLGDAAQARRTAVEAAKIDGLNLEFGVAAGGTAREMLSFGLDEIWGFDHFYGLPVAWTGHIEPKGAFSTEGVVPSVEGLNIVNGLFSNTLPTFMRDHSGPISLVHIDCDIYSSTVTIFVNIEDRIEIGTVLIFDELKGYSSWRDHEAKALIEHTVRTGFEYEVLGRSDDGQRFVMRRVK